MPTPISVDLRIRIVEARVQDGQTYEQLAERFHVGRATVDRVLRLQRETGSVEPKPHGGGVERRITAREQDLIVELVRARPDATLAELCFALQVRAGVQVSRSTMCRELQELGFTRKKNRWFPESSARPQSWRCATPSSRRCSPATPSA
ncbi:helix-turn-helix domain-containing protein [Nannocystis exedens]|uniref:helix-turn-helix domain-containing protein n=1 Tax=Nannocystis exedens TaxID=54 RepID=UPI00117BF948|nr:helix-turn-helix domain-containing protein [Nannocystis exedens]